MTQRQRNVFMVIGLTSGPEAQRGKQQVSRVCVVLCVLRETRRARCDGVVCLYVSKLIIITGNYNSLCPVVV